MANALDVTNRSTVLVADEYDALIRGGSLHERAVKIIVQGKGTHLDPDLADAFVAIAERIRQIAARYADSGTSREGARQDSATKP